MKKILLYGMLLAIIGIACRKEGTETWYGTTLDKRLADTIAARQNALTSSPYGWKTVFTPKGGGAYLFYMKFANDNRVEMVSDVNIDAASNVSTSSYIFRTTGQPSLIFDTYSPLHIISHPYNPISGGTGGEGKTADYEFYFQSVTADSVVLIGVKNKNIMVLKKATQEEEAFYKGGGIKNIIDEASNAFKRARLYILENGAETKVELSFVSKTLSLTRKDANNADVTTTAAFTFAADGLDLVKPLTYEGVSFNKVYWDSAQKQFYILINGNKIPIVAVAPPPLHTLIGTPGYRYLAVDPPSMPQTAGFDAILQRDIANTTLVNRSYNHFYFDFNPPAGQIKQGSNVTFGVTTASSSYWIEWNSYLMEWVNQNEGIVKFSFKGNNGSNSTTLTFSVNLRAFFENHTFKIDYSDVAGPAGKVMGSFICVEDPSIAFYGRFESTWSNW